MSIETITDLAKALPEVSKTIPKKKRPTVAPTPPISSMTSTIQKIFEFTSLIPNKNIVLLKNKEVIQWLFDDTSFLPPIEKKNKTQDNKKYKILEDEWGRKVTKIRRPDLKLNKQWTTCFGQHLSEEIYTLLGYEVTNDDKKKKWIDFFEPIFKRIGIAQFCIFISPWLDSFIIRYFNNLMGLTYQMPIKETGLKYTKTEFVGGRYKSFFKGARKNKTIKQFVDME